jgi:hypothetical protein
MQSFLVKNNELPQWSVSGTMKILAWADVSTPA